MSEKMCVKARNTCAGGSENVKGRYDGAEGLPGGGGHHEEHEAPEPGAAAGRVHARAALLHHHGVHVARQPARLPAHRARRLRARRRRAHVHGHADRLRHELPREPLLHTQVPRHMFYFITQTYNEKIVSI